jgi:hypothetical protein
MLVDEFIEGYIKNTLGKKTVCGNWSVLNWGLMDTLRYTKTEIKEDRYYDYDKRTYIYHEPEIKKYHEDIAYRLNDGSILFNSNRLKYATKYAYGNRLNRWGNEPEQCQLILEKNGAIPIPFTLFEETNTDVRDFSWIVKPVPETLKVLQTRGLSYNQKPYPIDRHFSGACVFSINDDQYLFDVDRQEIENHLIFNPFVTKLPSKVKSIKEAYEVLMPDEVKKAISDKKEVLRQGEFYFIKVSDNCPVQPILSEEEKEILKFPPSKIGYGIQGNERLTWISDDRSPYEKEEELTTTAHKDFQKKAIAYKAVFDKFEGTQTRPGSLGKSTTGSHNVEKYVKDKEITYVSGTVKQNRREHGDLLLTSWYKVIANTGVISWTITGDID